MKGRSWSEYENRDEGRGLCWCTRPRHVPRALTRGCSVWCQELCLPGPGPRLCQRTAWVSATQTGRKGVISGPRHVHGVKDTTMQRYSRPNRCCKSQTKRQAPVTHERCYGLINKPLKCSNAPASRATVILAFAPAPKSRHSTREYSLSTSSPSV